MLQLHLSDQQCYCLLRCVLYKILFGRSQWVNHASGSLRTPWAQFDDIRMLLTEWKLPHIYWVYITALLYEFDEMWLVLESSQWEAFYAVCLNNWDHTLYDLSYAVSGHFCSPIIQACISQCICDSIAVSFSLSSHNCVTGNCVYPSGWMIVLSQNTIIRLSDNR